MDQEDMIDLLDLSDEYLQGQREQIRREQSLEEQAKYLLIGLSGLAHAPQELLEEEVEYCEDYVAGADVWRVGSDAHLVEIYSNDPRQIELAKAIRLACREALLAEEYCIFVRQALPLIHQIAEGVELPPLTPPLEPSSS